MLQLIFVGVNYNFVAVIITVADLPAPPSGGGKRKNVSTPPNPKVSKVAWIEQRDGGGIQKTSEFGEGSRREPWCSSNANREGSRREIRGSEYAANPAEYGGLPRHGEPMSGHQIANCGCSNPSSRATGLEGCWCRSCSCCADGNQ
ncbi:unnamed protein product [Linum trigynum]|uniref:Uncharacterized protein n=1 Tax=Linum trigynum TaxID=586398 RepID=A0AAV2ERF0_9ROSI